MKTVIKVVIGLSVMISIFFLFVLYGLNLMQIEDKYGGFQDLYYEIDKSDNYFIIIENKEVGLVQKLDDEILVTVDDCMKHLLNYSDKKIEVYRFEVNKTKNDFTLKDAVLLKNDNNTKLIFKN
ncbi:hypothetical protein [uncultured Flavobacterium sp.]|uniref:hypothetical protein n=1 Tax=uncultured Flavobacterium sp. TaxID=165435 RepID=UPI00262B1237|nr:hypothetical protein [uncultured Flavobacterium sp.]